MFSCPAPSHGPSPGPVVMPVAYGGYAAIPEGDPQGSGLSGLPSVPYMLELICADDIEVGWPRGLGQGPMDFWGLDINGY